MIKAISFQSVIDSKYPAVVRAAASKLMANDYMDVGSFLKELPQADLDDLTARGSRVIAGTSSIEDFDALILMACLLCQAEGCALDSSGVDARTSNLIILLSFEDLARKGIIQFHREKATLCDDHLDKDIASTL